MNRQYLIERESLKDLLRDVIEMAVDYYESQPVVDPDETIDVDAVIDDVLIDMDMGRYGVKEFQS